MPDLLRDPGSGPSPPRSAVLTGATGYIGARLATQLLATGCAVHAIVRPGGAPRLPPGCRAWEYDGTYAAMDRCFGEVGCVDAVFHLAALAGGQHRPAETSDLVQANILLPLHLIEAAAGRGVARFINTSTFWQHSLGTDAYVPFSLYAATKQAFEDLAAWYAGKGALCCTSLVLFDVYGPDDPRRKIVPLMIDAARQGSSLAMSPGWQRLNLVHVDDVVTAFLTAAALPPDPQKVMARYAIRTPVDYNLREIAAMIAELAKRPLAIEWGARPYRPGEIMQPWRGGGTLPQWSATIDLRTGLLQLCDRQALKGDSARASRTVPTIIPGE